MRIGAHDQQIRFDDCGVSGERLGQITMFPLKICDGHFFAMARKVGRQICTRYAF